MPSRQTITLGGTLLVGLLLFCGCLTSPETAPPAAPEPEPEPTFVQVSADSLDSAGHLVPAEPSVVSAKIDGSVGGELHNGRFSLQVPKGAWEGTLTVTMTVPNPTVMRCDLTIDKPDQNHFKQPVVLCGMCNNVVSANSADGMVFVCLNDMTGKWSPVAGSTTNANTGLVSASLQHFSQYGVAQGKAGW